jgi:hypothetical protein
MPSFNETALSWWVVLTLLSNAALPALAQAPSQTGGKTPQTPQAWALDEARSRLFLNPRDPYLQYVAMQLARRAGRAEEAVEQVAAGVNRAGRLAAGERRAGVDLFSIFTGALAVQESLQLDTMRGGAPVAAENDPGPRPERPADSQESPEYRKQMAEIYQQQLADWEQRRKAFDEAKRLRAQKSVPVTSLTGPTVKSHPWEKMLAGRRPELSPLARAVPEDFYYVEFRSVNKLLEAAETGDLWGTHLFNQAFREARTNDVGERVKRQLALETTPLLKPFYDLVVEEVAVAGSDPFLREGSDVTFVFRYKQPAVFKAQMENLLANAAKRDGARREAGQYLGVDYAHLATPGRELSVYEAYPAEGLCVRSNSLAAFRRVLAAVKGSDAGGKSVRRLGDTAEFAYIRTLMPRGAAEEDGLIYLSDPFIRRLVGPELKLTERRRMLCYNHLRMIGHAALMHLTEFGHAPDSLSTLAKTECAPGVFGDGQLICPSGGKYSLLAGGPSPMMTGACSHHGHAGFLTPNIEQPVITVSGEEAVEYKAFLDDYNQYWRTYFDPIAIRVKLAPRQYRLETVVLPLIDNSIYTGLAQGLGGEPEPLDALPVPQKNIFSVAARLNKDALLDEMKKEREQGGREDYITFQSGITSPFALERARTEEFLKKGVGNQIGLHVYDAPPTFDLNLMRLLGLMAGSFGGRSSFNSGGVELLIGAAIAALNSPIYISIPVQDAGVVDGYLEHLSRSLAGGSRAGGERAFLDSDAFRFQLTPRQTAFAYALRFDPIKLRLFYARIGGGLYVATKPFILEDLAAAEAERAKSGATPSTDNPAGHAMARVRAENWNQVLADYKLSWAENNREACLNNLSTVVNAGRALAAESHAKKSAATGDDFNIAAHRRADELCGAHLFCPEGGRYVVAADAKSAACSVHGDEANPRQPPAPNEASDLGRLMQGLRGVTATLSFLEDGLRAVVTVERK